MILKNDPDLIISYLEDESGLLGGRAEKVYVPENTAEAAEALRECASSSLPAAISGGGTGVTGGRVPFGGAVISTEKMKYVSDVFIAADGTRAVRAGAGATVREVKEKVLSQGCMYAPDPTEQSSFIGGNIATNASGSRGLKYGPTRNYVRKLKLVFSNGAVAEIERGKYFADRSGFMEMPASTGIGRFKLPSYALPGIKNAAGYYNRAGMDLVDLFIGQEGTLALIAEAELGLVGKIQRVLTGVAFFKDSESPFKFVNDAKTASEQGRGAELLIDPMSLEYFDHGALELLKEDYPNIPQGSKAAVFFEQAVTDEMSERAVDAWARLLEDSGADPASVWFGTTETEEKRFREFRHRLPEKVNEIVRKNKYPKTGTDLAVPDNALRSMIASYREELESSKIRHLIFGHIGESHMHANFLPDNETDYMKCRDIYLKLAKQAVSLGGTVSAEHGIGKLKHKFLEIMVGAPAIREMAALKRIIDPCAVLGRGNIYDENYLRG